jgi:hypothetical protein
MTINFLKFKNYLIKKDIILFDSQYRIAHFRLNNLHILLNNMTGGGNNTNLNILSKIKNLSPSQLNLFVTSLLNKNLNKLSYILNL